MRYFFCTTQCRETFIEHPTLYSTYKKHSDCRIKTRALRLATQLPANSADEIVALVKKMMGIKSVSIDSDTLSVSYDLRELTMTQIEVYLGRCGYQLHQGWLHRIRRGWVQEREETELANLAAAPIARCNRSPKGR